MKALYQKPNTSVVNVTIQPLMEVSTTNGVVNNVDVANEEYNGGAVLSRKHTSVWGDEEEF